MTSDEPFPSGSVVATPLPAVQLPEAAPPVAEEAPGRYIYCLTEELPTVAADLRGVSSAPVEVIAAGRLTAVVSAVPAAEEILLTRANGTSHLRVIEAVMAGTPVLPFAFGVVAPSATAITQMLMTQGPQLREAFDQVRDRVEVDLAARWADLPQIFQEIAASSPDIQRLRAQGRRLSQFAAIDVGHWVQRQLEGRRAEAEEALLNPLRPLAAAAKSLPRSGDTEICRSAFLLPCAQLSAFETVIAQQAERSTALLRLKLIGPTPPFNFVHLSISFTSPTSHVPH